MHLYPEPIPWPYYMPDPHSACMWSWSCRNWTPGPYISASEIGSPGLYISASETMWPHERQLQVCIRYIQVYGNNSEVGLATTNKTYRETWGLCFVGVNTFGSSISSSSEVLEIISIELDIFKDSYVSQNSFGSTAIGGGTDPWQADSEIEAELNSITIWVTAVALE